MPYCHDCPDRPKAGQIYEKTKCSGYSSDPSKACRPTDFRHDFKTHVSINSMPPQKPTDYDGFVGDDTKELPEDAWEWDIMRNAGRPEFNVLADTLVENFTEFFRAWLILKPETRDIIAQRMIGRSLKEIAIIHGITAQGVEHRQMRALCKLPLLRWLFKVKQTKEKRRAQRDSRKSNSSNGVG